MKTLLTTMENGLVLLTGPLGAVFAAASVAIARRGELRYLEQEKRVLPASANGG